MVAVNKKAGIVGEVTNAFLDVSRLGLATLALHSKAKMWNADGLVYLCPDDTIGVSYA